MKERPILFSAPMVQALLTGRKTQTRRIIKPQPDHSQYHEFGGKLIHESDHRMWCWKNVVVDNIWDFPGNDDRKELAAASPYGVPGDQLWVRETWTSAYQNGCFGTAMRADNSFSQGKRMHPKGPHFHAKELGEHVRWRPSIFMPRWASRISLDFVEVRVQRLQEISEEDCIAEGVERWVVGDGWREYGLSAKDEAVCGPPMPTAKDSYRTLWESINGPGSWSANPFVWALTFKEVSR